MPLPRPFVQFALNFFEELLRDVREVGTLGNVLTDEYVGVLVGSALLVPSVTMPQMLVQSAALFAKEVKSYSQFGLKMARFRGTDKNEFIDNKKVEGNFFELLDAGMEFLFKHLSISGKIVGLRREEKLEIPAEALFRVFVTAFAAALVATFGLSARVLVLRIRLLVGGCETGQCKHFARLLAGSGVDEKVLEEDLRIAGRHDAVLGLVLCQRSPA